MSHSDQSSDSGMVPSWEAIVGGYIQSGIPGLLVIREDPSVILFIDSNATRIGVRFATSDVEAPPLSPLDAITVVNVTIDDVRFIEVGTTTAELYRNFYFFLADVLAEVVGRGITARIALSESLSRWQALLRKTAVLTEERQTGLFGELWVLQRLIDCGGATAVRAWTGPTKQAHDFRLADVEIEVKTTTGVRRLHTINGITQLVPSPDCTLFIASLRVENSGMGGETLPDAVAAVRRRLASQELMNALFSAGLAASGYRDADSAFYSRRRRLADAPIVVPVSDGCPRLTTELLKDAPSRYVTDRIVDISYRIDLTNLGFPDGSIEFLRVLPGSVGWASGA